MYIRFTSNPTVEVYPRYIVNDNPVPPSCNPVTPSCNTVTPSCNPVPPSCNTVTPSCNGRVRSGVVVAATLTMFVVGIVLGLIVGLVVCVCIQHFKSRAFTPSSNNLKEEGRYERHFDEAGDDNLDLNAPPSSL